MRCLEARNASTLLVNEDRRIGPTHAIAQVPSELTHLRRLDQIAGKDDEAKRIRGLEERPLRRRQFRTGAA